MYKSIVLKTDGSIQVIDKSDYHFSLQELYKQVSCSTIQIVHANIPGLLMCLDDVGKIVHKPINRLATALYAPEYDYVVGDVVLGTNMGARFSDEPDIYALADDVAAEVIEYLEGIKKLM